MDRNRLNEIFRMAELSARYGSDGLTKDEWQELEQWIRQSDFNRKLFEDFTHVGNREQARERLRSYNLDAAWEKAKGRINKRSSSRLWWQSAAAALILTIGISFFFQHNDKPDKQIIASTRNESIYDVQPGGNKAVLTLANGNQLVLDSNANGVLAKQGNMQVINLNAGQLAYKPSLGEESANKTVQYNTLTTPKGGQYQIILPDGTKVWLNSVSSLQYPTSFSGNNRKVILTGEAYFEVVHDAEKPFQVIANGTTISVLGTDFNVNAYKDEPTMRTTLVAGSIKVDNLLLKPGEQAVIQDGHSNISKDVDIIGVTAWKNGFFAFNNASLKEVMRKLSRWYDIEVEYEPDVDNTQKFSGSIGRNLTLSQILNGLQQTRAHFRIEANRKVVILR